jgi:hypothetical protein
MPHENTIYKTVFYQSFYLPPPHETNGPMLFGVIVKKVSVLKLEAATIKQSRGDTDILEDSLDLLQNESNCLWLTVRRHI